MGEKTRKTKTRIIEYFSICQSLIDKKTRIFFEKIELTNFFSNVEKRSKKLIPKLLPGYRCFINKSSVAASAGLKRAVSFCKSTVDFLRSLPLKRVFFGIFPKKWPGLAFYKSLLKNVFLVFVDVSVMLATIAIITAFYAFKKTTIPAGSVLGTADQTTIIYDRTGNHVLYEIHGEENRKVVSHAEIPDDIRLATIASEDDNFLSHPGIDLKSIIRAMTTDIRTSELQQGGSTITQQLVRNAYLSRDKTLRRKILEAILAMKMERKYSKDEILDMYLNEVPYGSNAYGVETAAETFFGKSARDLTLDESALLAALPNAPTYFSPYGDNADELVARKNGILEKMVAQNLISRDSADSAEKTDSLAKIVPYHEVIDCPHFVFYVKEKLEEMYGPEEVAKGGFKVYTSLDYDMQKKAEQIVSQGVANDRTWNANNAALVSMDPKNGEILAMVGSRDFYDSSNDGQVNVATRPRQPGSSFKPFAYSAAFEKGYQPETMLLDAPTDFGPDGSGRDYVPNNYDGSFHGPVTMRQALAMSLNVPAVKTLYLAGVQDTIDLAHRLGITTLNKKNFYGLSLALGGGEVTLLDETAGYSVFANDGKRNPATPFSRIEDSGGQTIYASAPQNIPALSEQTARKINSILSDNNARVPMFGPNNKLHLPDRTVAAKTGTSQDFRDAWTVGYTPDLVTGVWVGNNDYHPMRAGADGSFVAAPIWYDFMTYALANKPNDSFIAYANEGQKTDYNFDTFQNDTEMPQNFRISYYNKKTGKKLSDRKRAKMDPNDVEIRYEYDRSQWSDAYSAKKYAPNTRRSDSNSG